MKSKIPLIISLVVLVAACILAYFTGNAILDYVAIAVSFAASTVIALNALRKPGKSKVINTIAVVLFIVAGVFAAVSGLSAETINTVATAVIAVISLVASLIVGAIGRKQTE